MPRPPVSGEVGSGWASREPVRSLYVHAPFCARRCIYCDFPSTENPTGSFSAWLEAIGKELEVVLGEGLFPLAPDLETLFVGGGTPSVLGPRAMEGLAEVLGPGRLAGPSLEWTAEANPESFTEEVAGAWARAGVNRISLGVQSFQAIALRWMGRLHSPEGGKEAVARSRRHGIENINLDLIFGLPDVVERNWERDLDQALSCGAPHVSLYGLSVEEGTSLGKAVREGSIPAPREARYREEFLLASERLVAEGYRHYEVSNFALPGYECRHNRVYWNREPYLGLGNGAHSFRHAYRRWNLRSWHDYRIAARSGRPTWQEEEVLTEEDARLERIWLGLRTDRGVTLEELDPSVRELARRWSREGWAREREGTLGLTPEGWLLLDALTVELDSALG